jgi:PhzF family phenazine biosynthesis protein
MPAQPRVETPRPGRHVESVFPRPIAKAAIGPGGWTWTDAVAPSYSSPVRIRVIDAFTDKPFAGNPAGVCLLDSVGWPADAWMRQVAAELGHETAFAHPLPRDPHADWALRWFTPTAESNLCGHATLATAHAMHTDRARPLTVRFASSSGILTAHTRDDSTVTLDFPAAPLTAAPTPDGFTEALGNEADAVYRTGALGDLLAVVGDETTVRSLSPDFPAMAHLTRQHGIRGIIATAVAKDPDRGFDFISRYFAPAGGIPEDPVTGSAHTALAPYWSHRLGRDSLTGLQASARTGLVHTAIHGHRVHLTGHAVTVFDGILHTYQGQV